MRTRMHGKHYQQNIGLSYSRRVRHLKVTNIDRRSETVALFPKFLRNNIIVVSRDAQQVEHRNFTNVQLDRLSIKPKKQARGISCIPTAQRV
jgi:hypothetical protein